MPPNRLGDRLSIALGVLLVCLLWYMAINGASTATLIFDTIMFSVLFVVHWKIQHL